MYAICSKNTPKTLDKNINMPLTNTLKTKLNIN